MKCRRVLADDYLEICQWWEAHGWTAISISLLPIGFLVEEKGEKKAAGFIYMAQGVPVAYFEYVVTNPENTPRQSAASLDFLFSEVMKFLEYSMVQVCFSRIEQASLAKMYAKHGFSCGDKMQDMIWRAP